MKKASVRMVDTPHGEGRLHTRRATSPIATRKGSLTHPLSKANLTK